MADIAYIYDQPEWPNFRWQIDQLTSHLAGVRHRQGRLFGRMEALGFELRSEATLQTLTQDVVTTSEIEGKILNEDAVRSSVARHLGMDIAGLVPADRDIDGVVEMMLDATQNHAAPLDAERLFGWHASLFPDGRSGLTRIAVGRWRHGPMQIVSGPFGRQGVHFDAPGAETLDHEMTQFLRWFENQDDIDPVLRAGVAHLWFVTIHPFDDGNGRIARAIADLALARSEGSAQRFYSMSAQICAGREDYYRMLEMTQKRDDLDITAWLGWFLETLDHAFDRAEATLATVLRKARFWQWPATAGLNDRQRLVLNRLLGYFEGKLTSMKYAKLAKTSQDTASRDIADLMRRGVLLRDSAGGRSTSFSLVEPPVG